MKPRTKLQIRVKALSDSLPKLTIEQQQWAFKHCLQHVALRTKTKTSCLDCGHVWATQNNRLLVQILGNTTCECPNCGEKLSIRDTRKQKFYQNEFVGWISTCEDFQLNRFFEIHAYYKAGTIPRLMIWEVVQQWLQPGNKNGVIARNRGSMGSYTDNFYGDLEIREKWNLAHKFNIYPTKIFPGAKCLPIYKRNGIAGMLPVKISPFDLFTAIITDSKAETLLKAKQYSLLGEAIGMNRKSSINIYWDSIKICIRNNYIIKDAITWLDHMYLLKYFKHDLHNPKYVCPKDLKLVHNKLVAKKAEIDNTRIYTDRLLDLGQSPETLKNMSAAGLKAKYDRLMDERNEARRLEQLEKQRKKAEQYESSYISAKGAWFGIMFTDGPLTIKILESLQEFIAESEAHKHCVFTNEYYKKQDSLIFSATVNGKPTETIEFDLKTMKVVQSRGLNNTSSKYNQQIIDLVNKNIPAIRKRLKTKKIKQQVAA